MKSFISLADFDARGLKELVKLSLKMKKNRSLYKSALKGKHIGVIFQKPSLRTKTAFSVGALELGADVLYYAPDEVKIGKREKVCDVARTLSRYLHGVVLRTFSHDDVIEFARFGTLPVINGLSDMEHPSQVLADIMTINEYRGDLKNLKAAYIGDGNNVCNSLIHAFSILGGNLFIASPKGYTPDKAVMLYSKNLGPGKVELVSSAFDAAKNADVIYTDVWTSMGMEEESVNRKEIFKEFQINDKLLSVADKKCIVMHCLPAHRGEEITDSVIDGKNSVVFEQAENRLHTAKAVLLNVVKRGKK